MHRCPCRATLREHPNHCWLRGRRAQPRPWLDIDQTPGGPRDHHWRASARIDHGPRSNQSCTAGRHTMKASTAVRTEADAGDCWNGFRPGDWLTSTGVRDFIVRNVTPYSGGEEFLAEPS